MAEVLERVSMENPLRKLVQGRALVYKSEMSEEEFDRFLLENGDLKIERDKYGTITIHPPMSFHSVDNEGEAFFYLKLWGMSNKHLGRVLSPSASFHLPDGSQPRADGVFVSKKRERQMPEGDIEKIPHVVPDFIMEVRSNTDRINALKKKMEEVWMENGVRLAWLIDPYSEKAWIYRADGSSEEIKAFDRKLFGEDVLPGFELDLSLLKISAE